jgi:hypothetical protein
MGSLGDRADTMVKEKKELQIMRWKHQKKARV